MLSYHKVGHEPWDAWGTWFYTPADAFAGQLAYLEQAGWEVIGLPTFVEGIARPDALPARAALITFDDGYRSVREVALPVLAERRYPAVVFMPSDFIGRNNDFDAGNAPEEPLCGWDDLRELERGGVSIESHGASHRAFSELDAEAQELELHRSKSTLEEGLGKTVNAIAYPYGDGGTDWGALDGALSRLGYSAAFLLWRWSGSLPDPGPVPPTAGGGRLGY
ncbi:MAG TPA: polysaccharide deacetylase family protein [Thermoleophilaceae bacterium]|nr:polysaccharide deacetylase family protein [Thermoleophilaceae bacterium]